MLAQQRSSVLQPAAPSRNATRLNRVIVWATRPGPQLESVRSVQKSEVSVLLPAEQPVAQPVAERSFGFGKAATLAAAALAVGFVVNKLRRRSEDMGYLYGVRNDPFMSGVMRNVNTVQMEELSPEIIAAARARRSRERANHKLDLEEIELPENHPWATRKPMSREQEAAIAQRLQVQPRTSQRGPHADQRSRLRQQGREQ